ncbi:MAG: DUF2339 domain-containing protein [Calditrichaeota bacterium]|nr:DUF2339 domain-containing protein [Calditrichota bacterium]
MDNSYEERIKSLEQQVRELKAAVEKLQSPGEQQNEQPAVPAVKEKPFISPVLKKMNEIRRPDAQKAQENTGEKWLGRLGIGLLLFGAVFLFKYSVDQGWITPLVRVLFGIGLGIILLMFGLRLYEKNKILSRLLIGGGIATYYITIFAAFQLFSLIAHSTAFTFMVLVTVMAFLLAVRQDEHILSLIGTLGGFLTPFILYTGQNNLPGLVTYTSLLIIGAMLTYMKKGWRLLLWLSAVSSWIVWSIAVDNLPYSAGYLTEKWSIQAGIIISWICFWGLPLIREILREKNPEKWTAPEMDWLKNRVTAQALAAANKHLHMLTLSTAIIGLTLTQFTWDFSDRTFGWIILVLALFYLAVFYYLKTQKLLQQLIFTHGMTGVILLSWAFLLLLENNTQFIVLVLQAWTIFIIGRRISDDKMEILGTVYITIMSFVLLIRVFSINADEPFIFNMQALSDLVTIGLFGYSAVKMRPQDRSIIYFFMTYVALMGWLLRELSGFENGQGIVTFLWGVLGISLFIIAIRRKEVQLRYLGGLTIAIVVGKLFLVDLSRLETIYRILLFLVFGGLLLMVSNYLTKILRKAESSDETVK